MNPGPNARRRAFGSLALGTLLWGGLVGPETVSGQSADGRSTTGVTQVSTGGQDPVRQASDALLQWRRDWENRDFERFSAHYAEVFQSNGLDRVTYLERKRGIFEKRPWQRIRINDVLWVAEQGAPDALLVRFVQEYDSPQGSDRSRKEQRWIRASQRWQLASEAEVILSESDASRVRTKMGASGGLGK